MLEKIGRILFLIFVVVACVTGRILRAQAEVTVSASVDRNQMRPGDTFTYSISITSQDSVSIETPRLPDLSGFEVISSWSGSQTSGSFINGQMQTQRSQVYNYQIVSAQEGKFTIGSAEVVVNGQTVLTNPIDITVNSGAPQAQTQAQPRGLPDPLEEMEDDLFSQLLKRRMGVGRAIEPTNPEDAFFIHVDVNKTKIFQGEQVTASWYLVTRGQIADIDTLKYPSLTGFWKEDIEVATRLNFQPEVINGVQYQKALLASYALFPIKSGSVTIDSYKAKCRVLYSSGIGWPRDKSIIKESESIKVEVMPLPQEGRPSSFTGGVGSYTVVGRLDESEMNANSPITLKIRVEGLGNAKFIDMPKINLPESIQSYDTKSEMKFFPNGRSYKEFETLLVPTVAGEITIPTIEFSFYDPVKKTYYSQTTNEISLKVSAAKDQSVIQAQQMQSITSGRDEKNIALPELMFSEESFLYLSTAQQFGSWGVFYFVTLFIFAIYAFKTFGRKEKREDLKNLIKRRMEGIHVRFEKNDWRKVGVELTNLIYSVVSEVAGLGGASYDFDTIIEKAPPSFQSDVAPKLKNLMNKLEIIGFAPESVVGLLKDKKELKKIIEETQKVLSQAVEYDFIKTDDDRDVIT